MYYLNPEVECPIHKGSLSLLTILAIRVIPLDPSYNETLNSRDYRTGLKQKRILTNFMSYGTRRFNIAFTRAIQ